MKNERMEYHREPNTWLGRTTERVAKQVVVFAGVYEFSGNVQEPSIEGTEDLMQYYADHPETDRELELTL